ncbi:MAG: hypothetical protein GXP63_00130 [DPANN group archaeon]|nr:hypothetical protein [DPANN group archaeon]
MPTDELGQILGPRQTVLITARTEKTPIGVKRVVDDLYPTDHHCLLSADPFHYAIVLPADSKMATTIRTSKSFCVNFLSLRFAGVMHDALRKDPDFQDKFAVLNINKTECRHIDAPCVREAAATMEVEVMSIEEFGKNVFIAGKVLRQTFSREEHRPFHLSGGRFTTTETIQ